MKNLQRGKVKGIKASEQERATRVASETNFQ